MLLPDFRGRSFVMNLTIANISTQVSAADLQAAVAAIGIQVSQHFQPEWGMTAALQGTAASIGDHTVKIRGNHDAIIYLGDSSQDPTRGVANALGYHSDVYPGVPYGFVYLDICADYGEQWTCTLSHEVLELLADPQANRTVTGTSPNGQGTVNYDLEVCDPTQGDSYNIGDINVSNFVGRAYFKMTGGSGKTNHLNLDLQAFGVRPGGYLQYEDSTGAHQIQGAKYRTSKRMLEGKALMGLGRRNARRADRLRQARETHA